MGQLLPARTSQEERDWLEILGIAAPPFTAGFLVAGAGIDAVKQSLCVILHSQTPLSHVHFIHRQFCGFAHKSEHNQILACGIPAPRNRSGLWNPSFYLHSETEVMESLVAPVPVGSGALSQCQELFPVPLQEPQLRSGCAESMEVRLINPGRGRACLAGNSSGPLLMTPAWKSGSAGTAGVSLAVWCHQVCPCCGQIRGGY